MNTDTNIISFSFGQTSGFMLRKLMDEYGASFDRKFKVIFENTGKEHNSTLDFGHEVEQRWGIEIIWLQYHRVPANSIPLTAVPDGIKRNNLRKKQAAGESDHWFRMVNYETASRYADTDNNPFDELLLWANVLPNQSNRMCSVQLKIRTRDRYLRGLGVGNFNSFIGIRADEANRRIEILANCDQYETPNFPLIGMGINKAAVNEWWDKQPFKLSVPNYEGNCRQCFLKKRWKRLAIAKAAPETAEWAAGWEAVFEKKCFGDGARFRANESYAALIQDSKHPEFDLGEFSQASSEEDDGCSCSIGGYRTSKFEE